MLSGLFSISWARTAHHPGENFWIHTCTHVADKQARVMCMFIAYVCFVFGSCRSSYSYVMDKMIRGVENLFRCWLDPENITKFPFPLTCSQIHFVCVWGGGLGNTVAFSLFPNHREGTRYYSFKCI